MNEHICKTCGETMQFVGTLLNGRLECQQCTEAVQLAKNIELARLEFEEDPKSDMLGARSGLSPVYHIGWVGFDVAQEFPAGGYNVMLVRYVDDAGNLVVNRLSDEEWRR